MITNNKKLQNLYLYRIASILFILFFSTSVLIAQETTKEPNTPVTGTYNSGIFLENQTVLMYPAKTFEIVINHRFGKISDGFKEMWGVYSPSNIRMGFNYSLRNNLQIGIGTTKFYKQQDLNIKWGLLEQTTNNKIPVSVVYFGSLFLDARETSSSFSYENYKYIHRLSYFHEILISRKFCDFFNMQIAPTYTHYNVTESASDTSSVRMRRQDQFGLSVLGKINMTPTIAFFFEYDHNFTKLYRKETDKFKEVKPNIAIGFENATASHSFQLFVTTASDITYQRNMVYNQNDFLHSGLMIGFNITRVFYK
jgi:hypothetical protein